MDRFSLIQSLIKKRGYRSYLEIGVLGGSNFFPVECQRKIAVDPNFRFNWKGRLGETFKNFSNVNARFFEMTSDQFFDTKAKSVFRNFKLDLALVDGMHEFQFALRDVFNCLDYLSDDGVIVMHDCNPLSAEAGCTFSEWKARNYSGFWNGDVWKAVLFLKETRADLNVFVVDTDHGLGIVTKGNRTIPSSDFDTVEKVSRLTYQDLAGNREEFLNLKSPAFLDDFVEKWRK